MASILAARKLAQYEEGKRLPVTISAIANSVHAGLQEMKAQLSLASLVRTENMSLVLNGLSHARVRGVVITAYFTE
jgi:hypothetical protein